MYLWPGTVAYGSAQNQPGLYIHSQNKKTEGLLLEEFTEIILLICT